MIRSKVLNQVMFLNAIFSHFRFSHFRFSLLIFSLFNFSLIIIGGCTRSTDSEKTRVSLSIPQQINPNALGSSSSSDPLITPSSYPSNGGMSKNLSNKVNSQVASADLSHLIINASGSGIKTPILLTWDSCRDCLNAPPVPSSFVLEIPQGESRLIQVLAIYQTTGTQSMMFFYGDQTLSLNQPEQFINIPVLSLGGAQQIISGSLSGRYFTGPNIGPTGVVNIKYSPPGKPSMLIDRSHIVNGWFNLFILRGIEFVYEVEGGISLFDGPISFDSVLFTPSNQVMKLAKPIYKSYESNIFRDREPEVSIVGWFGDSASRSGKYACYSFSTALTSQYKYSNTSTLLTITDSESTSMPSTEQLFDLNNSGSISHMGGVLTSSQSECSSQNEYTQFLSITTSSFQNGRDTIAGFYSPFQKQTNGEILSITTPANQTIKSISGKLLPDITQIQKISLFKQTGAHVQNYKLDQVPCGAISRGEIPGWIFAGEAPLSSDRTFTLLSNVTQDDIAAMTVGAICYSGEFGVAPFGIGIRTDKWNGSGVGGGSGSSSGPPTQLSLAKDSDPRSGTMTGMCIGIRIFPLDSFGRKTNSTSSFTFNISGSDPNGNSNFYSSYNNCNMSIGSLSGPQTFPANQNELVLYTKSSYFNPIPANAALSVNISNISLSGIPNASVSFPIKDYNNRTLMLELVDNLIPGLCYPAKIKYVNYSGYSYNVSSNTDIALAASSGLEVHSNASCSNIIQSIQIANSNQNANLWIKLQPSTPSATLNMSVATGDSADSSSKTLSQGGSDTNLSHVFLDGISSIMRDSCSGPYRIVALNAQYTPLPLPSTLGLSISLTGGNGNFYSDSSCLSAVHTSLSAGQYYDTFYLKMTTAGVSGINVGLGGITANIFPLTVNGLHHLDLSVIDTVPVNNGSCVEVRLQTKNYDNTNGSFSLDSTINLNGQFFEQRFGGLSGICDSPINTISLKATDSSYKTLYVLVANNSINTGSYSISASAPNIMSANLGISVNGASVLTSFGPSSLNIAQEYNFDLLKVISSFTGITPFSFSKTSGSGALSGSFYTPSTGSAQFTISDFTNASFSLTAVSMVRSSLLNLTSTLNGSSLTRSSTATYFNSSGLLVTASVHTPRFDHNPDPASSYVENGLLIEGSSTNSILYSENFATNWNQSYVSVTADQVTAPDGNLTADLINWTSPTTTNMAYLSGSIQNWDVNSKYTASLFVKKNTARFIGMKIHQDGGVYGYGGIVVDLDTGNFVKMIDPWGFSNTVPPNEVGVQKLNNGWFRIWTTYVPINGSSTGWLYIYPVYHGGTVLSPNRDNTISGSTYFWGAQTEKSPYMTSYIPTTTGTMTRMADSLNISTSLITGFANGSGTIKLSAEMPNGYAQNIGVIAKLCSSNCASDFIQVAQVTGGFIGITSLFGSSANPSLQSLRPFVKGGLHHFGWSWSQDSTYPINFGMNGEALSPLGSMPAQGPVFSGGSMTIGNNDVGTAPLSLHIKSLEYWPSKLSGPAMASW